MTEHKPLAPYGRLGLDAIEPVPGWICIREIDIAAKNGRLPHYGECVAMAIDMPTARRLAAASDLLAAARKWISLAERGHLSSTQGSRRCLQMTRVAVAKAEDRP